MIQLTAIKNPTIKAELKSEKNSHTLSVSPLPRGFGPTLGNSLRRVIISSVPGCAVTRVRINDLTHEFQPIEGVVEDAMNIVLNLKSLRCKILTDDDKVTIRLNSKKEGEVRASDFDSAGKVEIVNPDLYICFLNKGTEIEIEIDISRGVGYMPVEKINFAGNINPQDILVDALFSPVSDVSLNIEKVRVGDVTDFDKLDLSFKTDGGVTGQEVVIFALSYMNSLFNQINSSLGLNLENMLEQKEEGKEVGNDEDQIELSDKILAILENNGITTNKDLKERGSEIADFAGLTATNLKKITKYIESL